MNLAGTQSDVAWRKRKYCGSGDLNIDFLGLVTTKQVKYPTAPFFVLAKESPPRASDTDSEVSIYDNYHNCETDYCKDTSDTDSYTTEGIATVDVLEYEVATSSASEHLYSNDSSSGTDDFVAAAVARAIFDSSTSNSSDKLDDLQADTEESDCPTDPELGRADYWTCVKCKNRQNNPMYRYCERCYQIRKNHFPPRPKRRKTRSRNTIKQTPPPRSAILSSTEDDDDDDVGAAEKEQHLRNGKSVNLKTGQLTKLNSSPANRNSKSLKGNSAGESSPSEDNDFDGDPIGREVAIDLNRSSSTFRLSSYSPNTSARVEKAQSDLTGCRVLENKFLKNVFETRSNSDTELSQLDMLDKPKPPTQLSLKRSKDSGFSSCSSQGLSPDVQQAKDLCSSSQETYCSEFESIDTRSDMHTDLVSCTQDSLQTLTPHNSNLSEMSMTTTVSSLRSTSSCSEQLSDSLINLDDIATMAQHKRRSYSDTETNNPMAVSPSTKMSKTNNLKFDNSCGLCMMCLAQPKNGVFVHSRVVHLCCCYQCAVKIWSKRKQCPVCNGKVKNVMKLFVH